MNAKPFIFSCFIAISACQDDPPPPDLKSISRAHCEIIQMCAPNDFNGAWGDLETCEASSADAFARTKDTDRMCYDALLARETCQSMNEDCMQYKLDCLDEYYEWQTKCVFPHST
jgi:hypothetical protein